jgi:oligoribonuclease NrnB/cAMP/cGMP phosphodiesterase (DHH superfamily)
MAYGQPIPEEINYANDSVIMVDFSLQPLSVMEDFVSKLPRGQFVWIDHHKTSLDMEEASLDLLKPIPGVRKVVDAEGTPIAACELTWKFFHSDDPMPPGIELLGSWDTWRHEKEGNEKARQFITYCNSVDCLPYSPEGREFWARVLQSTNDEYGWLYDTVLREGSVISRYQKTDYRKRVLGRGFSGKFGGYSAIMINDSASSLLFEDFRVSPDTVDLMVAFTYTKHGYWTISMYSKQEHIDCGAIAKQLGEAGPKPSGGGHKDAAGFQADWTYIEKLTERA